jgi:hypothetical protein
MTLVMLCMCGIVFLRLRLREAGHSEAVHGTRGRVQTAIAASPFDALGAGVIVSDGLGQPEPEATGQPLRVTSGSDTRPVIDPELLAGVIDKTGLDRDARAYYHLATVANRATATALERYARTRPFALLWDDPQEHRGELVRLKGYVRGLTAMAAVRDAELNPGRIETLYQGYLFTDDSRPNFYVIIVPALAPGMPTGRNITESVSFAGYFLKLYRYESADRSVRAAPLLIGRMITWTPTPTSDGAVRFGSYLAGGVVSIVVLLGSVMWWVNRRTSSCAAGPATDPLAQTKADLAELERVDSDGDAPETKNPDRL